LFDLQAALYGEEIKMLHLLEYRKTAIDLGYAMRTALRIECIDLEYAKRNKKLETTEM